MATAAIAFDTHKFVKHLTKHGFTEEQAEVLANEQVTLLNSNLATKADIATIHANIATIHADIEQLKQATKTDIEQLRLATKADIATIKVELLKWMIGALIAQGGIVVGLIKLL